MSAQSHRNAQPTLGDRSGNVALLAALMLPVLCLSAGAGLDYQRWRLQETRLQEFADTLALRGAREFLLATADAHSIESLVESIAPELAGQMGVGEFDIGVEADRDAASVDVRISQSADRLLLAHFYPHKGDMAAEATAVARGGMKVCVIALEENAGGAVATDDKAVLDATPCSILSNSTDSSGVTALHKSAIKAGMICSAGGSSGPQENFQPEVTTDCPLYPDPLAERAPPPVGACDENGFRVGHIDSIVSSLPIVQVTLRPGVYCGGLRIEDFADVQFEPGIYVIKDGPLTVGKHSTLNGTNIAFYLTGAPSTFLFEKDASISMSAPKDGPLAGILFFEDRASPVGRAHRIESEDAREFLGTFYLPQGVLEIDTTKPVADSSAYTAIVARRIDLKGKPTLVLNADYASTDVPVPNGIGPVGGQVFLRE